MTENIYSKLETLITYPSVVGLRVIVDAATPEPLTAIKKMVNKIEPNGMQEVTEPPRKSAKGTYVSYTIPVLVTKAENISALYKGLATIEHVKHVI